MLCLNWSSATKLSKIMVAGRPSGRPAIILLRGGLPGLGGEQTDSTAYANYFKYSQICFVDFRAYRHPGFCVAGKSGRSFS
jgi:hypothetical protein